MLLQHLRERKLIQWSLAYLAAAWALLQVLGFLADQFAWPAGIVRAATVFLGIMFLAVVVAAWYHGERGAQRVSAAEAATLGVILLLATAAAFLLAPPPPGAEAASGNLAGDVPEQASVAVLPFVNLSNDAGNEYFSDGVTEEILNTLSQVNGLRVASRTSSFQFKGQQIDVGDVARRLNVAAILEGGVRHAGDRIRVTAQLVDARNGYQMWGESFDRELKDVFAVQEEIARAITAALSVELTAPDSARIGRRPTDDIDAYTTDLRARFFHNNYTERDLRHALELYQQATELDPAFADPWVGIAMAWANLADDWVAPHDAYPRAREASLRALALDSMDAESQFGAVSVLQAYEWNGDASRVHIERGLALNPFSADGHWFAAMDEMIFRRNYDEAARLLRRGAELDPLAGLHSHYLARTYIAQRRWADAERESRRLLAVNPRYVMAYRTLGDAQLGAGDAAAALQSYRTGLQLDAGLVRLRAGEIGALAALGREAEARRRMDELLAEAEQRYVRAEEIAQGWAALGETDRAFAALERAYEARSAGLLFLESWPAYDPLRADPRFDALIERVVGR